MDKKILDGIKKFNLMRMRFESCFSGLPHTQAIIINLLISKADPETGIASGIIYSELVSILFVAPSSGRFKSKTPTKQTIRSYLRTIEHSFSEYFQVISEGQNLKIWFPTLPGVYASYFDVENTDLYTDKSTHLNTVKTISNTESNDAFLVDKNTEEYTDLYTDSYTPECPVKNNNIFNIKNKQQTTETTKLSICDDFYPNAKTIELAQSRGLFSVTDKAQIRKFINYNQAKDTKWADYNPVFLNWLEQDSKHTQRAVQQKEPRRARDECYSNKPSKSKPTLADVIYANQNSVSPGGSRLQQGVFIEGAHGMALDQDVPNLRAAIYK